MTHSSHTLATHKRSIISELSPIPKIGSIHLTLRKKASARGKIAILSVHLSFLSGKWIENASERISFHYYVECDRAREITCLMFHSFHPCPHWPKKMQRWIAVRMPNGIGMHLRGFYSIATEYHISKWLKYFYQFLNECVSQLLSHRKGPFAD